MKCLPRSKLAMAKGNVLHDCHAEVLAIRAFNRFLIDECTALAKGLTSKSTYVRRRAASESIQDSTQHFTVNEGTLIHMYCSEAPCGDASMELVMRAQEDSTPWKILPTSASESDGPDPEAVMMGRGHFSRLGIVRRKPCKVVCHLGQIRY
jgi:tRNA-specific adenosine deaminase 1